jgi:hypothetical protein
MRGVYSHSAIKAVGFVLGLAVCSTANAATYYVSNTGSDSNPGTSLSAPFQTISMAATVLVAGDTCYIRGGTYRETLTVQSSGTANAPITFSAYNNETAVISGADVITGWSLYSGNIYQAPMSWDLGMGFNQIFVDGVMMYQARFPSSAPGSSLLSPTLSNVSIGASTGQPATPFLYMTVLSGASVVAGPDTTVTSTDFTQADGYWDGCYFVGGIGGDWSWQWAPITNSSHTGTLTVNPTPTTNWWFTGAGQGYIFGSLKALGAAGEWHNQNNTLYLWPPVSDSPGTHLVEAKHRAWTIDFSHNNYVTVTGLQLFAGAVNMDGNGCSLINCSATYMSHFTLFPWDSGDGDGGASSGYQGITIGGNSNVVSGCTITKTAGTAIAIEGSGNLVIRCLIHEIDYSGSYGEPLWTGYTSSQNRIWFNTAYDSGRDIVYPAGSNQDIRYNDLYNSGALCEALGVIYTGYENAYESLPPGTRVAYNWIHDSPKTTLPLGPESGFYLDNYNRNFIVDHNVAWNCEGAYDIVLSLPCMGDQVYNNTMYNGGNVGSEDLAVYDAWPVGNPDPSIWTSDINQVASANNLFLNSNPSSQLVDPTNDNFQLIAGAPAIDAGVVVPGITDDYVGSAPDLGAYEYGGVRWTAGVNGIAAEAPVVDDSSGASNLQGASATLNGQLTNSFYQATQVIVYYGTADGGTTPSAWANNTTLNQAADGPFGATESGLSSGANYYYRCYASNVSGQGWAPTSVSFQTVSIPGSATIAVQPQSGSLPFGATVTLSVSPSGNGPFSYQWLLNGQTIGGATGSSYSAVAPGSYTVVVSNSVGGTTSSPAVVTAASRLINVSSRAPVGTGQNILIPGFVINGPPGSMKQVLIRASGPALSQFGVAGVLAEPSLSLSNSTGKVIASNTGWGTNTNAAQIATVASQVGAFAFPSGSPDCALLVNLAPGAYTFQISGQNSTTGVALAELYEVNTGDSNLVINISTRIQVGTGGNILIAGFVVQGSQPAKLLIRGDGPSLGQFGVTGTLTQPVLTIYDSKGDLVGTNSGWGTNANAAQIAASASVVGAFALPSNSADSALLLTLQPGAYTAQVSGANGSTGVALVEVYQSP